MDKTLSLAVLGTDLFGTLLAEKLLPVYGKKLAVIGSPPRAKELDNLRYLARTCPDYFPGGSQNLIDKFENLQEKIGAETGFYGGKPVDLHISAEGLYLLVEKNSQYKIIGTRILFLTAPAGADLVNNGLLLPGVDSAASGLLCRRLELPYYSNKNSTAVKYKSTPRLWRGDWGFKTGEEASTVHGRIYVAGEAAAGQPDPRQLEKLSYKFGETRPGVPPRPADDPFSPPYTDVELPRNFCREKMEKLKDLTTRLLNDDNSNEGLMTQFKQFSGEIAAYARFRSHPRLRRLLFKSLAARKIIQTNGE